MTNVEIYDFWLRNINHMKIEEMATEFNMSAQTFRIKVDKELQRRKEEYKKIKSL